MVKVITQIETSRPLQAVADYAANPDNAPEWYVNIKAVDWKTQPPLRVGSNIAFKAYFLGEKISYVYEIAENVPYGKLGMQTPDSPFPMETTYTWEANDDNSIRVTLRNRGNSKGFSSLMTPFMSRAMRRANNKDLKLLKKIFEQFYHPLIRVR